MSYIEFLNGLDKELAGTLANKILSSKHSSEFIEQEWNDLWNNQGLASERQVLHVRKSRGKVYDGPDNGLIELNFKARAFAQAFINTQPSKWTKLKQTLKQYPIDFWPYICDTKQKYAESLEWANLKIEDNFGLEHNFVNEESHLAFYRTYFDELEAANAYTNLQLQAAANDPRAMKTVRHKVDPLECDISGYTRVNRMLGERLFPWSGEFRKVNIAHCRAFGNESFNPYDPNILHKRFQAAHGEYTIHANHDKIEQETEEALRQLREQTYTKKHKKPKFANSGYEKPTSFAQAIAEPYLRLNDIHSFRRLCGWTNRAFFQAVANQNGLEIEWNSVPNKKWRLEAALEFKETGSCSKMVEGLTQAVRIKSQLNFG